MIKVFSAVILAATPAAVLAQQPASILIWPVNPVIEPSQKAAALWLENRGKAPVTMQVRVFAWAQQDGNNVCAPQQGIMGTPPIMTIPPGQRQLVRLTRTTPPPAEPEQAFRVVVDEIPTRPAPDLASTGAAVSFRMRYSLPLFSYAQNAGPKKRGENDAPNTPTELQWQVVRDGEGRFLEIANQGVVHARLADVAFTHEDLSSAVSKGLLGYVLPGSKVRFPLPDDTQVSSTLIATLNDGKPIELALGVN